MSKDKKIKLIIDVDEKLVCEGFERPFTEEERDILIRAIGNGTPYNPIIKCQGCKYQIKEWREDNRMKEKGYWVYGCEHFGDMMGYWGFGGNDNEFCSDAEPKGGAE